MAWRGASTLFWQRLTPCSWARRQGFTKVVAEKDARPTQAIEIAAKGDLVPPPNPPLWVPPTLVCQAGAFCCQRCAHAGGESL